MRQGYTREESIGRNCRFLQGPRTDRGTIQAVHDAVVNGSEITVKLLNHRKDHSEFWNLLHIAPIRDEHGQLQRFLGCQVDITAEMQLADSKLQVHAATPDCIRA